jgi:hypothetical protein
LHLRLLQHLLPLLLLRLLLHLCLPTLQLAALQLVGLLCCWGPALAVCSGALHWPARSCPSGTREARKHPWQLLLVVPLLSPALLPSM